MTVGVKSVLCLVLGRGSLWGFCFFSEAMPAHFRHMVLNRVICEGCPSHVHIWPGAGMLHEYLQSIEALRVIQEVCKISNTCKMCSKISAKGAPDVCTLL